MVLLTTTPQILQILSSLPATTISNLTSPSTPTATPTGSTNDDEAIDTTTSNPIPLPTNLTSPISHKTLIAISKLRHHHHNQTIPPLNTLLRGTKPYTAPPAPKPTPSAEYTALMTRLRAEQEQRDYGQLLAKQRTAYTGDVDAEEDKDDITPSLVFNILISVLLVGGAVFQLTKWWPNAGLRVLLSLASGLVVGSAEVGLYYIYRVKVGQARTKERAMKEKKVFLGEFVGAGAEDVGVRKIREVEKKEEIWGRGVNGGMRRRVREKWEKEEELRRKDDE